MFPMWSKSFCAVSGDLEVITWVVAYELEARNESKDCDDELAEDEVRNVELA